ncbi:MAG: sigma-70 family RNA polymerase sigma factor [Chloroflexi bacterium]|nr:sigma-70 family RNA polymerase sigma factor [Chloroflexota bacterium]
MICPTQRCTGAPDAIEASATDANLLAAIAGGDAAALAQLHQRYARLVFATALRVVGDWHEAEDVTQDLFVRVWLQAWRYDADRGRCGPWLRRIAHNLAVNRVQQRRVAEPLAVASEAEGRQLPDSRADVEGEVWAATQRRAVAAALTALPAAQRTVLVQAYYGGLSQGQIAAHTGLPLGTVKSRTRHGLRRLRELVGPSALGYGSSESSAPVYHGRGTG